MSEQKLSDIFHEPKTVSIGKWQVPLRRLTLADWAAAEQHFGGLDKFMAAVAGEQVMNAVLFVLYRLVKKVDPSVSLEMVGEMIEDLQEAVNIVNEVIAMSIPEAWRGKGTENSELIGGQSLPSQSANLESL